MTNRRDFLKTVGGGAALAALPHTPLTPLIKRTIPGRPSPRGAGAIAG